MGNVNCPLGWNCNANGGHTPGGTAYQPNTANANNGNTDQTTQYVAGSDGLAGSMITPNGGLGSFAGEVPIIEGFGQIFQTDAVAVGDIQNAALGTYVTGMTYQIDLWVGTPFTVFDLLQTSAATGSCPSGLPNPCAGPVFGTITANFLGTGATNLAEPGSSIPITPEATPGMWAPEIFLDYTATAADNGKPIGFSITVQPPSTGSANNEVSDFVILPPVAGSTPEPGTFVLVGAGMVSLAYILRKKTARSSSR